jgi:regulatory protein
MTDDLMKAFQKAKYYCAYQERSHSEVRNKLYSFKLHKNEVEQLLAQLIQEGFINEERFAIAFTGGKFRIKHWGKEKIKYALKQKQVSDYCIRKAIGSINDSDYNKIFISLADKKLNSLKSEKNIFIKMRKMKDFLIGNGFEIKMVNAYLKTLTIRGK